MQVSVLRRAIAGLILAILLRTIAIFINRKLGIGDGLSVGLSVLIVVAFFGGTIALLAPNIASQVQQLGEKLPQSADVATERVRQLPGGQWALDHLPSPQTLIQQSAESFGKLTGFLCSTLGALASLVVIVFMG